MYVAEHLKEMEVLLKKAPFWKFATLATVCIEQEYEMYAILAKGCFFDMTKFLDKVVKRFWQSVPTGYSVDDSYLLAIEESIFEPRDEWEEIALQVVKDMEHTFYALWGKNTNAAFENLNRQFEIAKKCAKVLGMSTKETDALLSDICTGQKGIVEEIVDISNKEKKTFLAEFQSKSKGQLIDFALMDKLRPVHNEKPAKKKLMEIRNTSVDFDMAAKEKKCYWLVDATPEHWVLKPWEKHGNGGAFVSFYEEKNLPELCRIMTTMYYSYAQHDYAENRVPERVRAFWYLYAYSRLCMYELVEKGYPMHEKSHVIHDMKWFADSIVSSAMIYAYAAGTEDLIPHLYRFATGLHKEQPDTRAQDYMELFAGENNEALYHRIEQWEKSDMREMLLWILKGDAKEFRKALLNSVRHTRKSYEMSGCLFGPWDYACVKIAQKYGIDIEPVRVAELLDWNFDETLIDRRKWQLPLQKEIDKWLVR